MPSVTASLAMGILTHRAGKIILVTGLKVLGRGQSVSQESVTVAPLH